MHEREELLIAQALDFLEKKGKTPSEASRAIRGSDGARNYYGRKFCGEQRLTVDDLFMLCEYLEVADRELYEALLDRAAPARESSPLQAPLAVSASYIAKLLRDSISSPLKPSEQEDLTAAVPDYFIDTIPKTLAVRPGAEYLELIERANDHPTIAFSLAREAVLRRAGRPPAAPEEILELAGLLNAWACSSLRIGRINFAASITAEALELHSPARFSPTYPPLMRTAASLFHELGKKSHALGLAEQAQLFSFRLEGPEGHARSALVFSGILIAYGLPIEAAQVLESLKDVPENQQFSVYYNLAHIHFNNGEFDLAEENLLSAQPNDPHEELFLRWLMAKLMTARSLDDKALEQFEKLFIDSVGRLQPLDRLLMFFDMVPTLRRQSDSLTTTRFASRILADLEKIEMNDTTRGLREDLMQAATRGVLRSEIEVAYRKPLLQDH